MLNTNLYELEKEEVQLFTANVMCKQYKGRLELILTSKKIILKRNRGLLRKEAEVLTILLLSDIKVYDEKIQVKQKGREVIIQSISQDYILNFDGIIPAKKFCVELINVTTGTTMLKRGTEKIKEVMDVVDNTLEIDTKGMARSILQNGIKRTIINGIEEKN